MVKEQARECSDAENSKIANIPREAKCRKKMLEA
jgi:hypothetical protein